MQQPSTRRSGPLLARRFFLGSCACLLVLPSAGCATMDRPEGAVAAQTVSVTMPSGTSDALLYHPAGNGRWPAVLVWTDTAGLRPAYDQIGRTIAAQGYVVLIPNAYYRSIKLDGSVAPPAATPDQARERSTQWRAATTEEAIGSDARAYMAFIDRQPQTDTRRKGGTLGFDYGSANAFYAAQAMPDRIGAVAALYPSGTATPRPNSPHLFVNRSRAAYYVALARNDDVREPGDKDDYRKAFADAGLTGTVDVVPADHGFAVAGESAFDQGVASGIFAQVLALFRKHLN